MMKKQYEQPMAEKIEFNYRNTVVASGSGPDVGNLKPIPNGNSGCYHSNNSAERGCDPVYE